jgi:peptide/nickel transport system permease protein
MFKFLFKRFMSLIPVMFIISVMLFGLFKSMPGDPVKLMIPAGIKSEVQRQMIYDQKVQQLGLDKSLPEQYVRWIINTASGDFGTSTSFNKPVVDVISTPLQNSIKLNVFVVVLSFLISIPVGIKSAVKRHSLFDSFWQVFSLVGLSMPVFFIGLLLIFAIAINLRLLPAGGMPFRFDGNFINDTLQWAKYMTLPVITLTIGNLAGTIRYVRNAMIEVISKDFIRTARSKGLSEKVIIYSHAFRNALIPVVTLVAGSLVGLFGGAAITETIFAWNGIGYVLIQALNSRDYMVVLTMNLFYAVLSLTANILMDIGYALVDPRIKLK